MTTATQRQAAIDIGNSIRFQHSQERIRLRSLAPTDSRLRAAQILRENTYPRMKARYLLESVHRFGPVRVGKLIRKAALPAGRLDRKLADLSERERHLIADYLEDLERPAQMSPDFSVEDRAFIQRLCETIAERTTHQAERNRLRAIARKCELGV